MKPLQRWRAGFAVLRRHVRNAGAHPDRWYWIARRMASILRTGRLGAVLERHAIVDDLYADYPAWIDLYDHLNDAQREVLRDHAQHLPGTPQISVLLPTFESKLPELAAAIASVRAQLYPHWELVIVDDGSRNPELQHYLASLPPDPRFTLVKRDTNGGIAACLNTALDAARGEYVAFLDHDDLLHEEALLRVAEAIVAEPDVALVYTDEDLIDGQGTRHRPHFKPDWNEEWIRTTNYVLHLCVARTQDARAIGGMRAGIDGVQDWDFVLRLSEHAGMSRIRHVPRVLYHWRVAPGSTAAGVHQKQGIEPAQRQVMDAMLARRAIAARVEHDLGGWHLRYAPPSPPPLVSIVIPTRDEAALLQRCIDSIRSNTSYPACEIILVNHASTQPAAVALLAEFRNDPGIRVVDFQGEFNYSALCNRGVREARGSIIVLLNNDVEVIDNSWLDRLVGHATQPGVGMVGALLLYPDDTIQHAGVVLGLNGTADRPYLGYRRGHSGIAGRALAAQDVSAVVTACVAMQRTIYDEAGGMDESFAVSHNDLDLCLRVIACGNRIVWTPSVALVHHEGVSRGLENSPRDRARAEDEARRFLARWSAVVADDPHYNPNLALGDVAFRLAYPPRSRA